MILLALTPALSRRTGRGGKREEEMQAGGARKTKTPSLALPRSTRGGDKRQDRCEWKERNENVRRVINFFIACIVVLMMSTQEVRATDRVVGNLIQFNENGAWCWYQDPRLVVDPANRTLLVSSIATKDGFEGDSRAGDVDVVAYQLDTGVRSRFVLRAGFEPQDDHNAAALLIRTDGRYLAVYARHNHDNITYWRISSKPHDIGDWGAEQSFDWTDAIKAAGRIAM